MISVTFSILVKFFSFEVDNNLWTIAFLCISIPCFQVFLSFRTYHDICMNHSSCKAIKISTGTLKIVQLNQPKHLPEKMTLVKIKITVRCFSTLGIVQLNKNTRDKFDLMQTTSDNCQELPANEIQKYRMRKAALNLQNVLPSKIILPVLPCNY